MQYQGGKYKIAEELTNVIASRRKNYTLCVEPFMGGCNVTTHLAQIFDLVWAYDKRQDMVLLRQALAKGWEPPSFVSEDEYKSLKNAEPSALRGFVGQACSFGGKWWGGYARNNIGYNYAGASCRAVLRETKLMKNVVFTFGDFLTNVPLRSNVVLYCDPPYADTLGYGPERFDHERFWLRVRQWVAAGALAFVSEQIAPPDFIAVWKKQKTKGFRSSCGTHEALSECLFVHESQV